MAPDAAAGIPLAKTQSFPPVAAPSEYPIGTDASLAGAIYNKSRQAAQRGFTVLNPGRCQKERVSRRPALFAVGKFSDNPASLNERLG